MSNLKHSQVNPISISVLDSSSRDPTCLAKIPSSLMDNLSCPWWRQLLGFSPFSLLSRPHCNQVSLLLSRAASCITEVSGQACSGGPESLRWSIPCTQTHTVLEARSVNSLDKSMHRGERILRDALLSMLSSCDSIPHRYPGGLLLILKNQQHPSG